MQAKHTSLAWIKTNVYVEVNYLSHHVCTLLRKEGLKTKSLNIKLLSTNVMNLNFAFLDQDGPMDIQKLYSLL